MTDLVEHYKKNPMVETLGTVLQLKQVRKLKLLLLWVERVLPWHLPHLCTGQPAVLVTGYMRAG